MKFYELTLIMLLVNAFGIALTSSGLFTAMGMTGAINFGDMSTVETRINTMENATMSGISDTVSGTGIIETAYAWFSSFVQKLTGNIGGFFNQMKAYILWPSMILQIFGVPSQIGHAFTAVFNIIQIVGLIQFISGRNFKGMD